MYAYGIRGPIFKWFESYVLTDLSMLLMMVSIRIHPFLNVEGSILGPPLFNIFTNNIFNVSNYYLL